MFIAHCVGKIMNVAGAGDFRASVANARCIREESPPPELRSRLARTLADCRPVFGAAMPKHLERSWASAWAGFLSRCAQSCELDMSDWDNPEFAHALQFAITLKLAHDVLLGEGNGRWAEVTRKYPVLAKCFHIPDIPVPVPLGLHLPDRLSQNARREFTRLRESSPSYDIRALATGKLVLDGMSDLTEVRSDSLPRSRRLDHGSSSNYQTRLAFAIHVIHLSGAEPTRTLIPERRVGLLRYLADDIPTEERIIGGELRHVNVVRVIPPTMADAGYKVLNRYVWNQLLNRWLSAPSSSAQPAGARGRQAGASTRASAITSQVVTKETRGEINVVWKKEVLDLTSAVALVRSSRWWPIVCGLWPTPLLQMRLTNRPSWQLEALVPPGPS